MADALSITAAQILALFLETFFAGINVVTFGMVVSVLVFKRPGSGRASFGGSWLLVFIASALFIIAMFDALLQLTYVLYAFVWFTGEGGAEVVFDDISYWQDGMKTVNYCVQTSIADFMLVYRCHIVYERNWLLTVPLSILWLGGVATGLYTSVAEFLVTSAASNHLNTGVLVPLITSNISITLALNLIATSLIVWKIRRVQLAAQRVYSSSGYTSGNTSFGRVIRIIVESGALYSIGIIIFLPLYIVSSNAQIGVSDAVIQIIGISFNLIIVRIYQGRTIETTIYDQTFTSKSATQSNPSARAQQQTIRFRHTRTGESSGLDGELDNDMVMGRVNDPISSSEDADKVLYEGRDFA